MDFSEYWNGSTPKSTGLSNQSCCVLYIYSRKIPKFSDTPRCNEPTRIANDPTTTSTYDSLWSNLLAALLARKTSIPQHNSSKLSAQPLRIPSCNHSSLSLSDEIRALSHPISQRSLANALHQVRGEACDLVAQALGGDGGHLLRDLLVDPASGTGWHRVVVGKFWTIFEGDKMVL